MALVSALDMSHVEVNKCSLSNCITDGKIILIANLTDSWSRQRSRLGHCAGIGIPQGGLYFVIHFG
jgi:hypothetical protein